MRALREERDRLKDDWAAGACVGDTQAETAALTADALSKVFVYNGVLEFEFLDIEEEEETDE